MSDTPDNVTPFQPRAPIFVVSEQDAIPMDAPDVEITGVLEAMLVLARAGRIRALGIAAVTLAAPMEPGDPEEHLTVTRFVCRAFKHKYALYAALRRLFLRFEEDAII